MPGSAANRLAQAELSSSAPLRAFFAREFYPDIEVQAWTRPAECVRRSPPQSWFTPGRACAAGGLAVRVGPVVFSGVCYLDEEAQAWTRPAEWGWAFLTNCLFSQG